MKKLLLLTTLLAGGITMFAQHQHYLITGTYTHGISKGIYVHLFDSQTGTATEVSFTEAGNPSYLVVSPDGKFVYAVHEEANPKTGGAVSAYSFHNGKLTLLNTQPTNGAHPCYIAIDQTGKWVTVANYSGGSLALFPIKEDGSLDAASSYIQHTGSGPDKDRQEAPHVHSTVIAPDNKHVLASDLGLDRIAVYEVKGTTPTLAPAAEPFVSTTPASGPRHLVFAPNKKFAYMIEELSGHVVVFKCYSAIVVTGPGATGICR